MRFSVPSSGWRACSHTRLRSAWAGCWASSLMCSRLPASALRWIT
ncbi:hypothetical protein EHM92_09380 [bacterium]|nr:MAG: hypothetical protein EHM92_09380 [bacterium]